MSTDNDQPDTTPNLELAFSKFTEEIEKDAVEKTKIILAEAKVEAKKIKDAAKRESDKISTAVLNAAKREADQIKVREISRKKLSVKMDFLISRDEVIEELLDGAKSKLQSFTKSEAYGDFMQNLLKISAISMNGGNLEVSVNSDDKSIFTKEILGSINESVSSASGTSTKIAISKYYLNTIGGLRLVREDDRLFVDNTFEARLGRNEQSIRVALVDILES